MEDTNINFDFQDTQEPEVTSISLEDLLSSFFPSNNSFSNINSYFDINVGLNFRDYFNGMMEDMLVEQVMQNSLEDQPDLVKTDRNIIIASQSFSTLDIKIQGDNKECSICISEFEEEDIISIPNCNHIFHTECIKEWARYKTDCPVCREKIE